MGGPAQKEQDLTQRIDTSEATLRAVLSSVPSPMAAKSAQLTGQVENAEGRVRELIGLAKQIDGMFGRSVAGEIADISKEIGRMRAQLGAIGTEQVAGVNERYRGQAQRIDQELSGVETRLGGRSLSESRDAFNNARAGVEMLSETISAARGLFTAGAPQEMVAATDMALELFSKGEPERARLLLKAANMFIDNREFFTSDTGKPGAASLAVFATALADGQMDTAKADAILGRFMSSLAYPPEQRAADRDVIAGSVKELGAEAAGKIAATLDTWLGQENVEGAKKLADMAFTYMKLAEAGKDAAALDTLKAAMMVYADTGLQEAGARFSDTAARMMFAGDIGKLRDTVSAWGLGAPKSVTQNALERTEELLQEKKYGEAGNLLTFTAMYADSINTLGLAKRPDAPLSQDAASSIGNMARALGALGRGEAMDDGTDAGMLFVENYKAAVRSGQAMALQRSYQGLRQKFDGNVAWAKGLEPGLVPLGTRHKDGTWPGSMKIAELREYETKSGDAALKGQTLDQLLTACGRAAQSGDAEAYGRSMDAFTKRFSLVSSRYFAGQMAGGVEQMAKALESIKKAYGGGGPADASSRLDRLGDGMREFSAELRSGAKLDETVPRLQYDALCSAFKREQAAAMITNQAGLNEGYASMAKGITGSMAGVSLKESTVHFTNAKKALLNGDNATARREYEAAMNQRQAALALFSAFGKEKEGGVDVRPLFDGWRKTHMDIFDGVLAGKDTAKLQERVGLVEISVFALPEKERGFIDFSRGQKNIREFALAGKTAEAEAEWARMQKALEMQKLWTNVGKTVAGIAVGFVPGGQLVSAAIFTSMVTNQAIDEAAATGRVSGMTWAMLGITVATVGLGGVVSELKQAAEIAKSLGRLRAAATYGTAAKGLTVTGLGAGAVMTGLAIPATIQAFREGRYGEAWFNVAMMAFPFAHMGAVHVRGRITAARTRAADAKAAGEFNREMEALLHGKAAMVPERVVQPGETARPVEAANLAAYETYMKTGMLPEKPTQAHLDYIQERLRGATHEEAMAMAGGTYRGPTAAEIKRRMEAARDNEACSSTVESFDFRAADRAAVDAAIMERGAARRWMAGGEELAGEAASTGRILRGIESHITALVRGGEDLDVIVVSGDKAKLNQINQMMGRGYGDHALDAYRELLRRSVYDASGKDGIAFLVRPSQSGDEAIGVIIVRGGAGGSVHERLAGALARNTRTVFDEYMQPEHPQTLAPVRGLVRDPLDLVAEAIDVSEPVAVRRGAGGRVAAANRDGTDAMVTHQIETPAGRETVTEFMPKLVRSADEQGSASHAPHMRRMLNSGVDTEIRRAQNIAEITVGQRVSGMAFEMRLEVTDPTVLAEARALLPKTRKALAEVLTNRFDIRAFNTFLGHYGANKVVNAVEAAAGEYAAAGGLTIRRLGTMKYVMEGGTPEQISALNAHVSGRLRQAGMKFRVGDGVRPGSAVENASAADALATISNGHLKLEWGAANYENANAIISSMAIGNDETLMRLLGSDYGHMRGLVDLVRKNPAIRNVEDLMIALHDTRLGGTGGPAMETAFKAFVTGRGTEFRGMLETLAPPAEAMVLRRAVGAEEVVLQRAPEAPRSERAPQRAPQQAIETLERSIGAKPRGAELEAALKMLATEEERAVARVLDAIMVGEVKGKLPPEYRRVIDDIGKEGLGKAGEAAAAAERALIVVSSVPDVMNARSVIAMEEAMATQGIKGELAEDAIALFKTIKSMHLKDSEMRWSGEDHFAVMDRIERGVPEPEAVIQVAAEKKAAYEQAADALQAALQNERQFRQTDAELAMNLLRWRYGRKMDFTDQQVLTKKVLDALDRHFDEGKGDVEAVIATAKQMAKEKAVAGAPQLGEPSRTALTEMLGKGAIGERYLGYFTENGLTDDFLAMAARKIGGGKIESPAVRSLLFEMFNMAPDELRAYFRLAAKVERVPLLDTESIAKSPQARAFREGRGEVPTAPLLSADGVRMFSYAYSYLKFAADVVRDIETAHASGKPVVIVVPLAGGYIPARTVQFVLNAEGKSGLLSGIRLLGSPSDATKGMDYAALARSIQAKYGKGGATCVILDEILSGNSVMKALKTAERVRNEIGTQFEFLIYGAFGQNDLVKCTVSDEALVRAANDGTLSFENPLMQENAANVSGGEMPLATFMNPRTKRAAMGVDYTRLPESDAFNFSAREKDPADKSAGSLFSAFGSTQVEIAGEMREFLAPKEGIRVKMGMVSNLFSMDNPYMSYEKQVARGGRVVFDAVSFTAGRKQAFPMQQELYALYEAILKVKAGHQ
ncbi:MAG: hypothetical protein PHV13_02755 [Candidatus ainarchaeum sp.]|nr:hypothetical protein [Candidatus ainarchaeum sp.]